MPAIDIAIVNFRGTDDTLAALQRLDPWPHGTVWVVDNSAHEPDQAHSAQVLREAIARAPWARLLAPGRNLGFGQACNLAFNDSQSEHFLLLNPDARIAQDDVLRLARTLDQQPTLAAVSPRIYWNEQRSFLLPSASPQGPWASLGQAWATRSPRRTRQAAREYLTHERRGMAQPQPFDVQVLAGAVLLLRRGAVQTAGGLFDPDYFMFFEDADLSLRLRRQGLRLAMDPGASAVHEYRHKPFKEALMADSQQLYFRKRYPLFHRLSGGLRRVQALARPMDPQQWFNMLPGPTPSLQAFTEQTGSAAVLAFSPSPLMVPAIFRPDPETAQPFNQAEWDLLEPGSYVALLRGPGNAAAEASRWTLFQR